MIQIKKYKPLRNESETTEIKVPKPEKDGFIKVGRLIVGRVDNQWTVYDDICDHNGGVLQLSSDGVHAHCPRHQWQLELSTGSYVNGCRKKKLEFEEDSAHLRVFQKSERFPNLKRGHLANEKIRFDFNAHASVSVETGQLKIITDPWLIGSCFATGWWHRYPPSQAAIKRLQEADIIYISHNHPDHLHVPTIRKYVSSKTAFLVPSFESKSVEIILKRAGYNNLIVADFLQEIEISKTNEPVKFLILKSGDSRDDSSLLIVTKTQSVFFGVDTNMPNRWILPQVDLVFTPFASNASGYPHRIDNLTAQEKTKIAQRNCSDYLASHVLRLAKTCAAKFIVPYAGYFQVSDRDRDIKLEESTNSENVAVEFIEQKLPHVRAINPITSPSFELERGELRMLNNHAKNHLNSLENSFVDHEIQEFSVEAPPLGKQLLESLGKDLIQSKFEDNLTILIIPTDNQFEPAGDYFIQCDFSKQFRGFFLKKTTELQLNEIEWAVAQQGNHLEVLRIRQDSLRGAIKNGLTLEELSIGFQIRMYRNPNVYNSNFWNYFSQRSLGLFS